jgi:hypothetical protein
MEPVLICSGEFTIKVEGVDEYVGVQKNHGHATGQFAKYHLGRSRPSSTWMM